MLSYLNSFSFGAKNNRPHDDIPTTVYDSLDWDKTVIAGSYALQQFTNDNWTPNDIDIMISCNDVEEFRNEFCRFEQKTGACLERYAWFSDKSLPNKDDELFHELVLGSRTYTVPNCSKKVQLICLQKNNRRPEETLMETTDIPSCVSYKMVSGQKMFFIPEKGVDILRTKRGPLAGVYPGRIEKYKQRGYTFY